MAGEGGTQGARRIPVTVTAIVDLLNSRPHGTDPAFPDRLEDARTAGAVLRPFGQSQDAAPGPERIAEVRDLRTILAGVVSVPDGSQAADLWADLTASASLVTFCADFSAPGSVRLRQVGGDRVVGGITRTVAELLSDGTWSRIRVCDNEACRHVFYDSTRSRTQRWHSYETCGNKSNVAAYRARKNAKSEH